MSAVSKDARRSRARPSLPSHPSTPPKTASDTAPLLPLLPLSPTPRRAAQANRKSLPAGAGLDPFRDTPSPNPSPVKSRALSTSSLGNLAVGSNNPFRQTQTTERASSAAGRVGPPLPPRKPSIRRPGPALPPRVVTRARADSASSRDQPTSQRESSSLIQQSLAAAAAATDDSGRSDVTVQVIRSTNQPHLPPPTRHVTPPAPQQGRRVSAPRDIIEQVTRAVRESEIDPPPPPPQRSVSAGRSRSAPTSASSGSGGFDMAAAQLRVKYPGLKTWAVAGLLSDRPLRSPFALIILNQPVTRLDTLFHAWASSAVRFCADGGANRLYDALDPDEREQMLPTMIKGDLDSIRPDVRSFYASRGVPIKRDPSEYSTDLQKCIEEVERIEDASGKHFSLLFFGGLSGRLDQTLHVISVLFKCREKRRDTFVMSEESLAWVLDAGVHAIEANYATMGQTCGILPIGGPAFVRTQGLEWNLDWETSIEGQLSTSNHLLPSEPVVLVDTTAAVVWTVEIRPGPSMPRTGSTSDVARGVKDFSAGVLGGVGKGIGQLNRRLRETSPRERRRKAEDTETDSDDSDIGERTEYRPLY